jgi:hypothetical protein
MTLHGLVVPSLTGVVQWCLFQALDTQTIIE